MNKEILQNYNSKLSENNIFLEDINNTINELPDISDLIEAFEITDGRYLFYNGARLEQYNAIKKCLGELTKTDYMFANNSTIKDFNLAGINTSKATSFESMFSGAYDMMEIDFNIIDLSSATSIRKMLTMCYDLTTVDFSTTSLDKVEYAEEALSYCSKLKNVIFGNNTLSKVKFLSKLFNGSGQLETLDLSMLNLESCVRIDGAFSGLSKLTNLQFCKNLGKGYTQQTSNYYSYTVNVGTSINLTHDSLMSIINNLYDLNLSYDVANGGMLYTQQLLLGNTNLAKLTEEEIAIATNKGWVVS